MKELMRPVLWTLWVSCRAIAVPMIALKEAHHRQCQQERWGNAFVLHAAWFLPRGIFLLLYHSFEYAGTRWG